MTSSCGSIPAQTKFAYPCIPSRIEEMSSPPRGQRDKSGAFRFLREEAIFVYHSCPSKRVAVQAQRVLLFSRDALRDKNSFSRNLSRSVGPLSPSAAHIVSLAACPAQRCLSTAATCFMRCKLNLNPQITCKPKAPCHAGGFL